MHKAGAALEPNEIHAGTFFFYFSKKANVQTEAFGIDSFLIAVKEQGSIKAAGEWIKWNNVHYCIYTYIILTFLKAK